MEGGTAVRRKDERRGKGGREKERGERQKEGEAGGGKMEKEVEKLQNFHINL